MSVSSIITLAIIAGVIFLLISVFNRLVALRNRYQNAFAQIEVQLKRRYDLIPNLVETAKAYLKHERETLEAVIAARNAAVAGLKAASEQPGDAGRMAQLAAAENALGGAMGRLNVTLEATRTSRPRRTCSRSARNCRAPRTRSPSPARPTTTR